MNRKNHYRPLLLSIGMLLSSLMVPCAAQESTQNRTSAIHLVGHEDTALLQRVQDLIDDWDPRKLVNPYVQTVYSEGDKPGLMTRRKVLRRPDLAEFIADVEAAEALGKAFFWDMQAGSDLRRIKSQDGKSIVVGTACATCHFKNGADGRDRNTTRIPYVVWDKYWDGHETEYQAHPFVFNDSRQPFDVVAKSSQTFVPDEGQPFWMIVGSQGVEPRVFKGTRSASAAPYANGYWEKWDPRDPDGFVNYKPDWSMFIEGQKKAGRYFRQITTRNSPSVVNAGFADRLFHDGRAESTFNGFSIFGDHDQREVLYRRTVDGKLVPVQVAITDAALASQAVGPIVNEVEMSYFGRTFHNLACKLLDAEVLAHQSISQTDSLLAEIAKKKGTADKVTYAKLIRKAFRQEWWNDASCKPVDLMLSNTCESSDVLPQGNLMQANFSLYWGLSIMLYEASLVSNESPFDAMMAGNGKPVNELWDRIKAQGFEPIPLDRARTNEPKPNGVAPPNLVHGTEVFQLGFRLFMNRNCIECHSGPLFSELYERDRFEDNVLPIARRMHNILLANAQGDAVAIQIEPRKKQMLQDVGRLLGTLPLPAGDIGRMALTLEKLRERGGGNQALLAGLIEKEIASTPDATSTAVAGQIAERLLQYEKTLYNFVGNRTFFTEPERVATADLLAGSVLVELMRIPPNQREQHRPLPFSGLFPDRDHAFYDASFYALGVAPPRYDRGIGRSSLLSAPVSDRMLQRAVAEHVEEQEKLPKEKQIPIPEVVRKSQQNQIVQAIRTPGGLRQLGYGENADAVAADILKRVQSEESARQSASGVSGSAYQFRREYRRRGGTKQFQMRNKAQPPGAPKPPGPCEASDCDLDSDARRQPFSDTSWDRDDIPENTRRSEHHFLSRARALVMNEDPWGFRKPLIHDNELAFWGAFKTPTLRNVSVTGPYMHNGRLTSLFEVVRFYAAGGHIPLNREHNPDRHPEMTGFDLTNEETWALVFFLHCLTDPRVVSEAGPFDHPEIDVVNGYNLDGKENILHVSKSR